MFITVEGIEGVGKSTCLEFIKQFMQDNQLECLMTREPGGTLVGEKIRAILLDPKNTDISDDTELLLMFAARAQHLHQVIKPSLAENKIVICDRFTDSTYAYQGGGRQLSKEKITALETLVQDSFRPDLVLLLTAPVDVALSRAKKRNTADRIEAEAADFFQRVQNAFLERANGQDNYRVIDASQDEAGVQQQINKVLAEVI